MEVIDIRRFMKHMKDNCSKVPNCTGCMLANGNKCITHTAKLFDFDIEGFIKAADKWCREHPIKSYRRDFFEKFPKAEKECFARRFCRNKVYGLGVCRYEDGIVKYCDMCWDENMDEESGNTDESKTE